MGMLNCPPLILYILAALLMIWSIATRLKLKVKKLTMLRHTIELCAATQIWRGLPVEKRQDILSKFVPDGEKAGLMANSIDIPTHVHQFHANWLSGGNGGSWWRRWRER